MVGLLRQAAVGPGIVVINPILSGSPIADGLSHNCGNQWHNRPMIWSAGDLGIEIDFGLLYKEPGAILQRKEKGRWHDYLVKSEPVVNPFDGPEVFQLATTRRE